MLAAGDVIRGKYRIERVIGEGGMGVVVAARHIALGQRVAIKFLLPRMLKRREFVERFAREARAASRIQSDHVARVIDVDTLENGAPFIVMEYLEGADLTRVRRRREPLAVAVAAGFVIDACDAIGEAHAMGIIHRDIKPANLFLAKLGGGRTRVKVLDFGISKMGAESEEPSVTSSGEVMGSGEYMSPEQMRSVRDVDAGTDIWALGVTLYELTTARVPFPGETITEICWRVMSDVPAPPSSLSSEIPAGFDAVVLRCLEKDKTRRYGSVGELAEALAPFAGRSPSSVLPVARPSVDRISSGGFGSAPGLGTAPLLPDGHAESGSPSAPSMGTVYMPGVNTIAAVSKGSGQAALTAPGARILLAVAVAGAALMAGGAFFFKHHRAANAEMTVGSEPSDSHESAATAIAPTAAAPTIAPVAETSAAPPTSPAPSAPTANPSSLDGQPVKPSSPHSVRPNAPNSAGRAPLPGKLNCDPPYTTDANGDKHAKPGCK